MRQRGYQLGFSDAHRQDMYDDQARAQKARKTLAILRDRLGDLAPLTLIDLGCSTGAMTRVYADHFREVVGVDIDQPAIGYARGQAPISNLRFDVADAMETGQPGGAFDVVTCCHVYEHVPDPARLMREIDRLLRPGGICFFAAGNRLTWMEADHGLPLLSVVPKPLGHLYVRAMGQGDSYYETTLTLWQLKRLVRGFQLTDYTVRVIDDPGRWQAEDMLRPGSAAHTLARLAVRAAYWLSPTYLWLLEKPGRRRPPERAS